ncbi:MAG: type I DNA topoisomerase [Bacteroidaceae bacterium]|nr:type I DNA topoisomerase [Bacteroidaceae bacterium]
MQNNLVIVESPAKAKTIGRFLGKDYRVMSSFGHIRDLKSKSFSIDTKSFQPQYEIPEDKKRVVNELLEQAKKSAQVWLASDEDREGEAISWHLAEVLNLDVKKTKRIVFHEITKNAIMAAIEKPRTINMNLVNAQQARRVLDRIVGFKLSPVLWRKVKPGLSAGRVQSVAVRLICDREKEIGQFESSSSFAVNAIFCIEQKDGSLVELKAELDRRFPSQAEAEAFLGHCGTARFVVDGISKKRVKRSPAPPFMTSTLQQEAAHKLGFSVSQTMRVAQALYEAGHITYMRTDSLNLSSLCVNTSKAYIEESYGAEYFKHRAYHTRAKGAQEAHEAIRPTYMDKTDISGTAQEKRLYQLIRRRTLASLMADAEYEKTTVSIQVSGREETFVANGEVQLFDGFMKVYQISNEEDADENFNTQLPVLRKGTVLSHKNVTATQRYTQGPARYNEASLVHKMEELGIGRPSTYAPTISTIQQRNYVVKGNCEGGTRSVLTLSLQNSGKVKLSEKKEKYGVEKNKLLPTDVGLVVNDFLLAEFPDILDYNFTAKVEKDFDAIASGDQEWGDMMRGFYNNFMPEVEKAIENKSQHKLGERLLGVDPDSGRTVSVKIGRYGTMVQMGSADDKLKPVFAPLLKGQNLDEITLDEALDLLRLPRTLGLYEGNPVQANNGRYGPYVVCNKQFVSIPKGMDVLSINLDEAIELIKQKEAQAAQRIVKQFEENEEIQILNGRFGLYISYRKKNYHLPKKVAEKVNELTLGQCMEIIEKQDAENAHKSPRQTGRKKK